MNIIKLDWKEKTSTEYFINDKMKEDVRKINSFFPENVNAILITSSGYLKSTGLCNHASLSIFNINNFNEFYEAVSYANKHRGQCLKGGSVIYGPDEIISQTIQGMAYDKHVLYANNSNLLRIYEEYRANEDLKKFMLKIKELNNPMY
jgi:hypothetical protein